MNHPCYLLYPCSLTFYLHPCSMLLYLIKVGIRFIRVEHLVAVHHRHQIFGIRKVDDIVSITGKHDDALYLVATYLVVQYFVCALLTELD